MVTVTWNSIEIQFMSTFWIENWIFNDTFGKNPVIRMETHMFVVNLTRTVAFVQQITVFMWFGQKLMYYID